MKTFTHFLLILAMTVLDGVAYAQPSYWQQSMLSQPGASVPSGPSLTCTLLGETLSGGGNLYNDGSGCLSTSWTAVSTSQVCEFDVFAATVNSNPTHIEIWTGPGSTGTLLGTSSSITASSGWNAYYFSSPVSISSGTTVYFTWITGTEWDYSSWAFAGGAGGVLPGLAFKTGLQAGEHPACRVYTEQ
jgi:hypothetical protein